MQTNALNLIFLFLLFSCEKDTSSEKNVIKDYEIVSEVLFKQAVVKDYFVLGINNYNTFFLKNCFQDEEILEINAHDVIHNISDFQKTSEGLFILCNGGSRLFYYELVNNDVSTNYEFRWTIEPTDSITGLGKFILSEDYLLQEIILAGTIVSLQSTNERQITNISLLKVDANGNITKLSDFENFSTEELSTITFRGYYGIQPVSLNDGYGILYRTNFYEFFRVEPTYFIKLNNSYEYIWKSEPISNSDLTKVFITKTDDYLFLTVIGPHPSENAHYIVTSLNTNGYRESYKSYGIFIGAQYNFNNNLAVLSIKEWPESYSLDIFDKTGSWLDGKEFISEFQILENTMMTWDNSYYIIGTKEYKTYIIRIEL